MNFAVLFAFAFFFLTLTHTAALNAVDAYRSSQKSEAQIVADYDMPFMVERPPDGMGWLLTRAHLRWLVREEIRLNAMRDGLNFDNERALKEYIAMLAEFNAVARNCCCEIVDFKAAKADIEPYRGKIEELARLEAEANGWNKWQ